MYYFAHDCKRLRDLCFPHTFPPKDCNYLNYLHTEGVGSYEATFLTLLCPVGAPIHSTTHVQVHIFLKRIKKNRSTFQVRLLFKKTVLIIGEKAEKKW